MGIHQRTIETGPKVNGYPMEYTYYYVYCDKCGSFNIKTHITLKKWIIISIAVLSSAAVWKNIGDFVSPGSRLFSGSELIGWWVIFVLLLLPILGKAWTYLGHKCRKCGNVHITYDNVPNYRSSVENIPKHLTHWHNRGNSKWYDEILFIPVFIIIILFFALSPIFMLLYAIYSGIKKVLKTTVSAAITLKSPNN